MTLLIDSLLMLPPLSYIRKADENLRRFAPAFLGGMQQSTAQKEYNAYVEELISKNEGFEGLARHLRNIEPTSQGKLKRVLDRAIATDDSAAVIECVAFCFDKYTDGNQQLIDTVLLPALG